MLIVTYHAIEGPKSPVCCPPDEFAAHLAGLRSAGFTFASMDECAEWIHHEREAPPRTVAVTFDDAYRSVVTNALPVLRQYQVPAIVYVIGERMGGDNQWPGQWTSIPRMPLARVDELRAWSAAGMAIGSHSWSHPRLTELDEDRLGQEIAGSADRLEQTLGVPIRHFAFPYGIRGRREIDVARRRYRTAVNASPDVVSRQSDACDLCRIDAHDLPLALRLGLYEPATLSPYLAVRRTIRRVRRRLEQLAG